MILLADSDGPDETVQADLGLHSPHMPEETFSHGTFRDTGLVSF